MQRKQEQQLRETLIERAHCSAPGGEPPVAARFPLLRDGGYLSGRFALVATVPRSGVGAQKRGREAAMGCTRHRQKVRRIGPAVTASRRTPKVASACCAVSGACTARTTCARLGSSLRALSVPLARCGAADNLGCNMQPTSYGSAGTHRSAHHDVWCGSSVVIDNEADPLVQVRPIPLLD